MDTFPEKITHQKAQEAAKAAGMYVVDLLPVYIMTGKNFKDFWVVPLDLHPSQEARRIEAQTIETALVSGGILKQRLAEMKKQSWVC